MYTKNILAFLLVVSCINVNSSSTSNDPVNIDCIAKKERSIMKPESGFVDLRCHVTGGQDEEILITADSLLLMSIFDKWTKNNYTLSEYPESIAGLYFRWSDKGTGKLTISENALKTLPNLTSITIDGFNGTVVDVPSDEFRNTANLTTLEMSNVDIPINTLLSIRSAPGLERLSILASTGEKVRPGSLRGLVNLKHLTLDQHGFSDIQNSVFDGLTELETISLQGNNISDLTQALPKDSRNLQRLNLHKNSITSIQEGAFAAYQHLLHISLSSNPITKIERGAFDEVQNLTHLKLGSCPIDYLPEGVFQNVKNLNLLDLSNTSISRINSTTFKDLNDLHELDIGGNQYLTTIEPGAFDDLVNVRSLSLKKNPSLSTLPEGLFATMTNLEAVDLWQTCIDNVSKNNFTHCPQLKSLWLAKNCTVGQE